ncbi:hypothetical protein WA026_021613, partial [Henosepilachna vigintioctopunctata]
FSFDGSTNPHSYYCDHHHHHQVAIGSDIQMSDIDNTSSLAVRITERWPSAIVVASLDDADSISSDIHLLQRHL